MHILNNLVLIQWRLRQGQLVLPLFRLLLLNLLLFCSINLSLRRLWLWSARLVLTHSHCSLTDLLIFCDIIIEVSWFFGSLRRALALCILFSSFCPLACWLVERVLTVLLSLFVFFVNHSPAFVNRSLGSCLRLVRKSLHSLVGFEFEALGQHLIDHCNLQLSCNEVTMISVFLVLVYLDIL
jgi:hypothetical protein